MPRKALDRHCERQSWRVEHGDCIAVMAAMPEASVDAIVCDPPYGLEFMGKEWDRLGDVGKASHQGFADEPGFKGFRLASYSGSANVKCGRCQRWKWDHDGRRCECGPDAVWPNVKALEGRRMQDWHEAWAREALRVLKPGGHLLAFGGSRTYHRLASGIEDAGFEIRDALQWLYGSGFPKSLDVSKAIDKAAGVEREVVGQYTHPATGRPHGDFRTDNERAAYGDFSMCEDSRSVTAPSTPDAQRWHGWGTALKPAHEPVVVARKPLAGTVAANVLAHGTGALNIDGCRIGAEGGTRGAGPGPSAGILGDGLNGDFGAPVPGLGRWPANVLLSHTDSCVSIGTKRIKPVGATARTEEHGMGQMLNNGGKGKAHPGFRGADGTETVEAWECTPDCPVRMLDEQTGERRSAYPGNPALAAAYEGTPTAENGVTSIPQNVAGLSYTDSGGASRFFYCAKADTDERNAGLTKATLFTPTDSPDRNDHPTVKPIDVMRWLVRLVTPPGGTVLDPFTGSGTTGCAAVLEGFNFIGIEREDAYVAIARARLSHWSAGITEAAA